MNKVNTSYFKNPKTVQLFNRFATYNGSNPYQTPGMLNIISHLELNKGPALPKGGMFMITKTLYDIAVQLGVTFSFNEKVEQILYSNNRATGLNTIKGDYLSDIVVSNMDVHFTYEKLLKDFPFHPKKILAQEKSSSAVVFYWGIKSEFSDLGLHNIFFSENYKKEFKSIFETKEMDSDPTIYVNITSKIEKKDAPANSENWFVMVNAPINVGQNWNEIVSILRKNILEKLSKVLKTDIESLIEVEEVMDPLKVEALYSGKQGSIYGNASNSRTAAFYRHPNFSKKLKGLYFTGVTVHPGGGIPLALNSAKIVERCVKDDFEL
jgi:phytoene desaturase